MKSICRIGIIGLILLLGMTGGLIMAQDESVSNDQGGVVVALINGEPIYLEALQETWEGMPESYRRQFPRGFQDLLEQWIRQYLLAQAARDKGIDREPETQKKIEYMTRQVLVQEYINREIIDQIEVDDQQIEAEYQANAALYTEPEARRVRHIMLSSDSAAEQARQALQAGESFSEVAREWSVSPDAEGGGDMGLVKRGDLGPEIESVVFSLETGSISQVIDSGYGYHIFLVEESRDSRLKAMEEVKDEITARLLPRLQQEAFEKVIEDLKSRAEIAVIEENLPVEKPAELQE